MSQDYQKVFKVCKELFQAREYSVEKEGYDDDLGWYLYGKEKSSSKIIQLYIITHPKLNVELIKYYYSILHQTDIKQAILVYQNNVTSSVHKLLQTIDIKIELFCIDELKYNLLKHELVPEHIKVSNVKKNDLKYPIMKKTDPVARFMGFKHGDIIKINRKDGSIYYRFVK